MVTQSHPAPSWSAQMLEQVAASWSVRSIEQGDIGSPERASINNLLKRDVAFVVNNGVSIGIEIKSDEARRYLDANGFVIRQDLPGIHQVDMYAQPLMGLAATADEAMPTRRRLFAFGQAHPTVVDDHAVEIALCAERMFDRHHVPEATRARRSAIRRQRLACHHRAHGKGALSDGLGL
jgi:hypothetical protein